MTQRVRMVLVLAGVGVVLWWLLRRKVQVTVTPPGEATVWTVDAQALDK